MCTGCIAGGGELSYGCLCLAKAHSVGMEGCLTGICTPP